MGDWVDALNEQHRGFALNQKDEALQEDAVSTDVLYGRISVSYEFIELSHLPRSIELYLGMRKPN